MKKTILLLLTVLLSLQFVAANSNSETESKGMGEAVSIEMWTKEGDVDGTLQWTKDLVAEFMEANPNITVELVKKEDVETLREDFQTASLAGVTPDLLWTVPDHFGPFWTAGLIQTVDAYVDLSNYLETITTDEGAWAVPMSSGNHLMLLYNKALVPNPPKTTEELIEMGLELTGDGQYGLVYNQTEPFWLVPWLGGFGGKVFAEDGVTPTLDTPEMVATLQFLFDLKNKHKITPTEADYNGADTLFKEGKAAMIINGDWSLGGYKDVLGDNLGVTRIPMVSSTKKWPAPYTGGVYFMIANDIDDAKAKAAAKLVEFFTSKDVQYAQVNDFSRLPALRAAYDAPAIENDPVVKGSAYQLEVGTPQPRVLEMRAVWDAMKPEMAQVLAGNTTPEDAAKFMQEAAEAGIAAQK